MIASSSLGQSRRSHRFPPYINNSAGYSESKRNVKSEGGSSRCFQKGKIQVVNLNQTKLKGNEEVSW